MTEIQKNVKHTTRSADETVTLGEQLASKLKPGNVVCLIGELATGKTQFVKGLAKGLGIDKEITSPTFVLLKQYEIPPHSPLYQRGAGGDLTLNHLDIYRVQGDLEALGFGFEDLLGIDQITVIEWANRLEDLLPKDTVEIYFEYVNENTRKITIKGYCCLTV